MLIDKLKAFFLSPQLWYSVAIIILGVTLWLIIKKFVKRFLKRESIYGRKETNIRFGAVIIKYIIAILALIMVLETNGINVTSLVTGLGIAGVIIGFALQDILKDLIMGTNIVWDEFFAVGDVVKYGEIIGKITYFNIKVTKLIDINTGNTFTISNRNISEIEIMSDWLDVKIPAPYEESLQRMTEVIHHIIRLIEELEEVTSCEYLGTDEFAESTCYYRIRLHCPPETRNSTRRQALGIIQQVYEEENIAIPYPHAEIKLQQK